MYRAEDQLTTSHWPTPQDYNEAVQNLHSNCEDQDLRVGSVTLNHLGLPSPISGSFATVYRVQSNGSDFALRCFLRNIQNLDQEQRYAAISEFVSQGHLSYSASFEFLKLGIKVGDNWFPALKMEWVSGLSLDSYIAVHMNDQQQLSDLCEQFKRMHLDLRSAGAAHGDLQHGNIIVDQTGALRLVDYDGMFVPSMQGMTSNELGHRNYQHPARGAQNFNAAMDNFSAWVIYASLRALTLDPQLYPRVKGGDDCLLFRRDDYLNPNQSTAFAMLEEHRLVEIRRLARFIRAQLKVDPDLVPPIMDDVPEVVGLEKLGSKPTSHTGSAPGNGASRESSHPAGAESDLHHWWERVISPSLRNATTLGFLGSPAMQGVTQTSAPVPVSPGSLLPVNLEPEFYASIGVARKVVFRSSAVNPVVWQGVALFNPLLWLMLAGFSSGRSMDSLLLLSMVVVNLTVEVLIWWAPVIEWALASFGMPVRGQVIDMLSISGTRSIGYRFRTKGSREYSGLVQLNEAEASRFRVGETLTVLYLPGFPNCHVIYKLCRCQVRPGISTLGAGIALMGSLLRGRAGLNLWHQLMASAAANTRSVTAPHNVVVAKEAELNTFTPRRAYWSNQQSPPPMIWQLAMLASPTFWLMFFWLPGNRELPIVAAFINICMMGWLWRGPLRARQFVVEGQVALGKIKKKFKLATNSSTEYAVQYSFRLPGGQEYVRLQKISKDEFQATAEGELVTVLYLPTGIEPESRLYKYLPYRAH